MYQKRTTFSLSLLQPVVNQNASVLVSSLVLMFLFRFYCKGASPSFEITITKYSVETKIKSNERHGIGRQHKCCFMEADKFWSLLARKLAGEASLRDLYELNKVVYEKPELQFWLRLVIDLWRNREAIAKEPGGEEAFLQLLQEAYQRKYLRYKKTFGNGGCLFG